MANKLTVQSLNDKFTAAVLDSSNFIKESKNSFNFKHMCSRDMVTNENRLMVAAIAYSIFNIFRRICLPEKWKKFRADEIRMRLLHIAGRHVLHAKKKFFRLCSTYLYKEQFSVIIQQPHDMLFMVYL